MNPKISVSISANLVDGTFPATNRREARRVRIRSFETLRAGSSVDSTIDLQLYTVLYCL